MCYRFKTCFFLAKTKATNLPIESKNLKKRKW